MSRIDTTFRTPTDLHSLSSSVPQPPSDANLEVKEKFQEFVAGTFYSQMLKALHKTHGKPAYFHGGQAEEIFQSQMDQQVATELSKTHGKAFTDPLFQAFQTHRQSSQSNPPRP